MSSNISGDNVYRKICEGVYKTFERDATKNDVCAFSEVMHRRAGPGRAGPDRAFYSPGRAGNFRPVQSTSRWLSLIKTRSVQQRDHLKAK